MPHNGAAAVILAQRARCDQPGPCITGAEGYQRGAMVCSTATLDYCAVLYLCYPALANPPRHQRPVLGVRAWGMVRVRVCGRGLNFGGVV